MTDVAATPPAAAGIERAVDTVLMALTAAHVQGHVVGLDDIAESVTAFYAQPISNEVLARLSRGPCSDDCALFEGIKHTADVFAQALIEHIAVEIDLLIQLRDGTGKLAQQALRELRERVDKAVTDGC